MQNVGRFAPTPSGPLHLGSLLAAVGSFLSAKAKAGVWLVRIEDVDEPRSRPEFGAEILKCLEGYGLQWDGEVIWQSKRTVTYEESLALLEQNGLVYPCSCTRKELHDLPSIGSERRYPGLCRNGMLAPLRDQFSWRLRVSDEVVELRDSRLGTKRCLPFSEQGDFILKRSDGFFSYQLAVVVDDLAQGVTEVVRGEDLFEETPKQIVLAKALQALSTPKLSPRVFRYTHLPLILGSDGAKLSKRHGAAPLPSAEPKKGLEALDVVLRTLGIVGFEVSDFATPREMIETVLASLKAGGKAPTWLNNDLHLRT